MPYCDGCPHLPGTNTMPEAWTAEQKRAAILLVSIARKTSADLLAALPPAAAETVVALSQQIQAIPAAERLRLLGECMTEWIESDPSGSVTRLVAWLQPEKSAAQPAAIRESPAFEALRKKNEAYIESLVGRTDTRLLALALCGASSGLRELCIRNLTIRRAGELRRWMDLMAIARAQDIENAQQMILRSLPQNSNPKEA